MSTRHLLFAISRNAFTAFLIIGISALVPTATASAAVALLDETTVRIYDSAGLGPGMKQSALTVAARTLAAASVAVHWEHCEGAGPTCRTPVSPGEFVVRIVRSTEVRWARAGLPLGDAHVDGATRGGVLATIYADRVMLLADAAGVDAATLLGRAIAHELGHLLLASTTHGSRGLMRPIWSREDLRKERAGDWMFTPQEIAAMRRRS